MVRQFFFGMSNFSSFFTQVHDFVIKYGKYLNTSYLDDSHVKYAKQVVRLLLRSAQELDETMKCYNLTNYFKPVATEEELVSYAVSGKTGAFVSSKALIRW